jgi:hypothetical protein
MNLLLENIKRYYCAINVEKKQKAIENKNK